MSDVSGSLCVDKLQMYVDYVTKALIMKRYGWYMKGKNVNIKISYCKVYTIIAGDRVCQGMENLHFV